MKIRASTQSPAKLKNVGAMPSALTTAGEPSATRAFAIYSMKTHSLSIETGQTTYLVVAAGADAVCLERVTVGARIQVLELEIGGSQPLHIGGAPRALLAFDETALLPVSWRAGSRAGPRPA